MKNLSFIVLLITGLFFSCSEQEPKTFAEEFMDTWNLTQLKGGSQFLTCPYDEGLYIWEVGKELIEIIETEDARTVCPMPLLDVTTYRVIGNSEKRFIEFNGFLILPTTIENDIMIITNDDLEYTFKRI